MPRRAIKAAAKSAGVPVDEFVETAIVSFVIADRLREHPDTTIALIRALNQLTPDQLVRVLQSAVEAS